MDWHDKKFLKTAFRLALLAMLAIITYLLYAYYQKQNLADYGMQNSYRYPEPVDSVRPSKTLAFANSGAGGIKSVPIEDSPASMYAHTNPYPPQNDSTASLPATLHQKNNDENEDTKDGKSANALHRPAAVFSRDYTIAIGKTVPVTVLWAVSGTRPAYFKLVTIKADDIADKKARFTIEDPFHVLLFSQTGYAANEKIIINDERHNINISVLQVHANSVVINITSHLNDGIVSKLQKVE